MSVKEISFYDTPRPGREILSSYVTRQAFPSRCMGENVLKDGFALRIVGLSPSIESAGFHSPGIIDRSNTRIFRPNAET